MQKCKFRVVLCCVVLCCVVLCCVVLCCVVLEIHLNTVESYIYEKIIKQNNKNTSNYYKTTSITDVHAQLVGLQRIASPLSLF